MAHCIDLNRWFNYSEATNTVVYQHSEYKRSIWNLVFKQSCNVITFSRL